MSAQPTGRNAFLAELAPAEYALFRPHLSSFNLPRGRFEGWPQTPSVLPSFETAARKSERPPQDDGVICCERRLTPDLDMR
jgi:hypothetical protein